jgi:hypothetical protein
MGRRGCDGENANSREPQLLQHAERSLRVRSATFTSVYCLRDFFEHSVVEIDLLY